MKLVWSRRARRDLKEIGRYIARDDPDAARRWVARLMARAAAAADCPLAGRVVPEVDVKGIREVFERSYRIVYRVRPSSIVVLAVLEGHRLLRPDAL